MSQDVMSEPPGRERPAARHAWVLFGALSRMSIMDVLLQFAAKIMVVIFFVGVVGSMVVVVISFVEDLELLVETDDEAAN